jgi:hypothetical protein
MGEMRNSCKIFSKRDLKGGDHVEDLGIGGGIIL